MGRLSLLHGIDGYKIDTATSTRKFQQRSGKIPGRRHISYHHIIAAYHHIIILSSYHHIIISSYHHIIIILSYHHIITSSDRQPKKNEKPLLSEFCRSSRDSRESLTDSRKSWDDRLNSPKSGVLIFLNFLELGGLVGTQ